jgi:hypothetical protein
MSFLSKFFGKNIKASNVDIFKKYALKTLRIAEIPITDSNILKATLYLCFGQLACIHSLSNGASAVFMDAMVEDVKNSILDLKMKVGDLATDSEELGRILMEFPSGSSVSELTTINGLAAFQAIYFQYVEEVVTDISAHTEGPMGPHGYAAIKLLEALRGKGNSHDNFFEVSMMLTVMTGEVIKAFR